MIDLTLIKFGWSFDVDLYRLSVGVIFVIGASMVALAALIWLPRWAIAGVSFIMLGGHDLLDGVRAEQLGEGSWAWHVLHEPGLVPLGEGANLYVLYPLNPWIGVMAAGYLLGPVMQLGRAAGNAFCSGLHCCDSGLIVLRLPIYMAIRPHGPFNRLGFNYPILPQLREISAIAALSDDDARARAYAARLL